MGLDPSPPPLLSRWKLSRWKSLSRWKWADENRNKKGLHTDRHHRLQKENPFLVDFQRATVESGDCIIRVWMYFCAHGRRKDTLKIILQHTTTHCNTLQYTASRYKTRIRHTATHCNTLQQAATHWYKLLYTAAHYITLQHTAAHYITLQHTAAHCSTLQHTAAHCSTLQHTATHGTTWNTLQHTAQRQEAAT